MNKVEQLKNHIQSLDGYKISNTHFKIGSKVHSSDFFYAKRLFQNSYYTARLAMLLAIQIKEKLGDKNKSLTLVGYEMYSELLLSLMKQFLNDSGYKKVNHFVIIDLDEKIKHIPDYVKLYDNAVIIIPIASTGSTAVKIEEYLKSINSNKVIAFVLKHYNIILATDTSDKFTGITQTSNQQSFIQLKATWHKPSDCELCFNNAESQSLFETDKSSLTPALIFKSPLAKINNIEASNVDFDDVKFAGALIYRKAKRNNEHFLFSTNTEILIKENDKTIIEKWLPDLKKKLAISPTDKVVIISPCHYSNTTFINLVNEKLFNSSATIIHHQIDVDYLANFKLLNQKYLSQKDAKIFFVDDSLISGKTFFSIYDLYRYTLMYKKDLSGAIFLSDKSSPDIHKRVSRATKENIYSFVNINLPISPKVFDKKPLDHEIKRYADLSQIVLHDVLKKEYCVKSRDLDGEECRQEGELEDKSEKSERHLKMFKATHKVYEFFGKTTDIQYIKFEDLLKECGFKYNEIEDKMAVMKVLSQYPFLLYMPIRKKTFEWHKEWLNIKIDELNKVLNDTAQTYLFTYSSFRELKFLIRRSVFLGNYEVLSRDFFSLINKVLKIINKSNNKNTLFKHISIENAQKGSEKKNLEDFHLFLLEQYVEMIEKNSWCAAKIIENLKNIENDFNTLQGGQFIRMLKIEAAVVINDFYSLLSKRKEWQELYKPRNENSFETTDTQTIIYNDEYNIEINKIFYHKEEDKDDIFKTNKFEICNKISELKKGNELNTEFLNYLWVRKFLDLDQNPIILEIALTDKTEAIFQKLKTIFKNNTNVGAFFIVTDGKENPHLVYDKDSSGNRFLKELDESKHDIVLNFLRGEADGQNIDKKTIIEFLNKENNEWIDLYAINPEATNKSFVNDYKWLLLIRISDSSFRTLGLMGFYSQDDLQNDLLAKQLLMLLRKDIGSFIKKHHKNDEFSTLRELEAKNRYAYLAGHGRQMIRELAKRQDNIFGDVVGTMEKLQYLFATKLISPIGNSRANKEESNKSLLKNVFTCTRIDKKVINNIIEIGNTIYKSTIIENEVDIEPLAPFNDDNFNFDFNSEILKFICFELLVNAKKNRFHFIGTTCTVCNTNKNELGIKFEIKENKLIVEVKGTGPSIPEPTISEINGGTADVKPEHEIAGLNLIRKVIKIFNNNNKLSINNNPIKKCCGINENTVRVELNPINND